MLSNYLKTAWRFLSRNIAFTLINIIGLTTGITAFLLIALYIQNELSYDKHFPRTEDTYRLVGIQEPPGLDMQHVAITSGGWAEFIRENIPQVEESFRIMWCPPATFEVNNEIFRETNIFYTEGQAVYFLGLPLIDGNPDISQPNQAVINKETAIKFFGTHQAAGQTLRNGDKIYTISGVFDNQSVRSHFEPMIFLSISSVEPELPYMQALTNNSVSTYVVLQQNSDQEPVIQTINNHYSEHINQAEYSSSMPITFYLQNAGDIYLRSNDLKFHMRHREGNITNVYIFSLIAVLILAIACINFINLATANSSKRSREVGLRKVLGSDNKKLALQFIGESVLITLVSIVLALGVVEWILPSFNSLLNTGLKIDFVSNPLFNIGLIIILLAVGLSSGLYPALYLARKQAIQVLKPQVTSGKSTTAWMRKALVIFQFAISTALIMSTIVVMNQVYFMKKKDRGYDPENVMALSLSNDVGYEQIENFCNHLRTYPDIKSIGIASNYNGVAGNQSYITVADSLNTNQMVRFGFINPDFFPTMGMEIIKGRNFSHNFATEKYNSIIINEATARALGWDDPIGKRFINNHNPDYDHYTVIGVVKDYHYYSIHNSIDPAVYVFNPNDMPVITIRYQNDNPQTLSARLESDFKSFFPKQYFSPFHVDEVLGRQVRSEENIMKIFTWFTILCIVISCLGLFGLTSFMVNQRRKEISLRKVIGGSVSQINILLLSGFLRLIFLAVVISLPITFLVMTRWLENYPYNINIGPLHFGLPVIIIVLIAAATVLILSTRAAIQNPAENLKYE